MAVIDSTAKIDCEELTLGDGAIIRAHAEIYGRRVEIGREAFIDEYAVIGGGSADTGELVAGDFFHMGMFSQVNTARDVRIGDEVGLGVGTRIFTHGAYLSEYEGFPASFDPVTIGSRVWLPNAIVLPGVSIGDNVVVRAASVVADDLPSGCLAGGVPARVVQEDAYPDPPRDRAEILQRICDEAGAGEVADEYVYIGETVFMIGSRQIDGPATPDAERLRDQLRRHGIRFGYSVVDGQYQSWGEG